MESYLLDSDILFLPLPKPFIIDRPFLADGLSFHQLDTGHSIDTSGGGLHRTRALSFWLFRVFVDETVEEM